MTIRILVKPQCFCSLHTHLVVALVAPLPVEATSSFEDHQPMKQKNKESSRDMRSVSDMFSQFLI